MKHPTAKPSEAQMRFFTPELCRQFNSADDVEADRADEAWEAALVSYRTHLARIGGRMTSQIKRLSELCLHDAEVLAIGEDIDPLVVPTGTEPARPAPFWTAVGVISLREEGGLISNIIYSLWDRIRYGPAPTVWPFSKARKHWLYDELDVATPQRDAFIHRILFSDGSIAELPFSSVVIHQFSLDKPDVTSAKKRKTA